MFDEFDELMVPVAANVELRVRRGGSGPPVVLLHGHPRTHTTWYRVAPLLVWAGFTVVCRDLRGYGQSSKPPSTADHAPYSKRAMAGDIRTLMRALGYERFAVVGHDRGSYVAFRLAMDVPEAVTYHAVLDSVPIAEALRRADARFATACTVHAMLEDYRAGLGVDRLADEADRAAGRRVSAPTLVPWSSRDDLEDLYGDILAVWARWATDVEGGVIDSGHHVAEEAPEELATRLTAFFTSR